MGMGACAFGGHQVEREGRGGEGGEHSSFGEVRLFENPGVSSGRYRFPTTSCVLGMGRPRLPDTVVAPLARATAGKGPRLTTPETGRSVPNTRAAKDDSMLRFQ